MQFVPIILFPKWDESGNLVFYLCMYIVVGNLSELFLDLHLVSLDYNAIGEGFKRNKYKIG